MILSLLAKDPLLFFSILIALVASITIHEFAHAWTADKLGDPTPRYQGRVTLNPLAHLDPVGTIAILLIGFGWGKPVMFDPYNLKEPRRDAALIAAAGPASNLILASIVSGAAALGLFSFLPTQAAALLVFYTVSINIMLMIFNLVPVYPLDGEKILTALLPKVQALNYHLFMQHYGMYVLLALLIPWGGVSPVSRLITPVIDTITSLLISGVLG